MSAKKPRIILIEDDLLIARTAQEMLEHLGCEVVGPIASLRSAINQCATVDADAAIVDLLLQGQEAYAVAAILAARYLPFGFADDGDHKHTDPDWTDRPILPKPYTMAGLRAFLLEVLPNHPQPV